MSFRHAVLAACCLAGLTVAASAEDETQPIKVSAVAKAACMPDALRLCRDAVPNVQNVLMCFDQNRDKISTRCRTVLAEYGLK
jgi:hypothetical protein